MRLGIFVPLLFLLGDFWQYPGLKHSQMVANDIASRNVESQAAVYIGRLKGHRILVSSDDIYDLQSDAFTNIDRDDYFAFIAEFSPHPTAIQFLKRLIAASRMIKINAHGLPWKRYRIETTLNS